MYTNIKLTHFTSMFHFYTHPKPRKLQSPWVIISDTKLIIISNTTFPNFDQMISTRCKRVM